MCVKNQYDYSIIIYVVSATGVTVRSKSQNTVVNIHCTRNNSEYLTAKRRNVHACTFVQVEKVTRSDGLI